MYQFLKFENPIPSCEIFEINYNNEKNNWEFIYSINTTKEITNNSNQENFIVYGHISDLIIKNVSSVVYGDSVNIEFNTLDEYIEILENQRIIDLAYRNAWEKANPEIAEKGPNNTIKLENKDYNNNELKKLNVHYIASIIYKNNNETIFAAV